MNDTEKTEQFLKHQQYMVLAVTLEDGTPWAVPVKIQRLQDNEFEWDSMSDTIHSQALETHPDMAMTVFTEQENIQIGFYAKGRGKKLWEHNGKSGLARYRFTAERCWLNDETFQKREVNPHTL